MHWFVDVEAGRAPAARCLPQYAGCTGLYKRNSALKVATTRSTAKAGSTTNNVLDVPGLRAAGDIVAAAA
jgi:hypothetical protein